MAKVSSTSFTGFFNPKTGSKPWEQKWKAEAELWATKLGLEILFNHDTGYFQVSPDARGVTTLCWGSIEKIHAYLAGRMDQLELMTK